MKLNKKIRTFLLALVLIPCAFVFCACGGGQLSQEAKVDTSGTYEKSTTSTLSEYVEQLPTEAQATFSNSYRATIEVTASGTTSKINAIMQYDNTNLQAAMSIEAIVAGEKVKSEAYIKDNFVYVSAEGQKMKMAIESWGGISAFDEYMNIGDMLNIFESAKSVSNIEVSVNGNVKKFKVDLSAYVEGSSVNRIYYIFDNDKFAGVSYEMTLGTTLSTKVVLAPYSGNINFPVLNEYTEISE